MAPCSSVSIVDFKHVNAGWVWVRRVYLVLYTFIEKMFRRYNQTGWNLIRCNTIFLNCKNTSDKSKMKWDEMKNYFV